MERNVGVDAGMTEFQSDSGHKRESADEAILHMFAELRPEEKRQFLIFFENALKTQSWPASDHRRHGKEAP